MPEPFEQLITSVEECLAAADVEAALRRVTAFVQTVNADPTSAGDLFSSPRLDRLLAEVVASLPPGPAGLRDDGGGDSSAQIYVATEVYAAGGHSRLIEDMILAQPGRSHQLVLTNLAGRVPASRHTARLEAAGADVVYAPFGPLLEKIAWLAAELARQPWARVFLFGHHEDVVALVGARLSRHPRVYFCHHTDHHLALGLHWTDWRHLDVTTFSYHHCREVLGVAGVRYLPLTTPEVAPRPASDFVAGPGDDTFVTCSSGNAGKFSADYAFPYPHLIAQRLATMAGSHLHIGGLDHPAKGLLVAECERLGVAAARFREIPHVPSLAAALAEEKVSVYIGSFPITGARATLEVMSTGTPLLGHGQVASDFLGGQCLLPEGSPVWRRPAEFFAALQGFGPERQREVGTLQRTHWEKYHRPAGLAAALAGMDVGAEPPPRHPPEAIDPLHEFFARRRGSSHLLDGISHRLSAFIGDKHVVVKEKNDALKASLAKARARIARLKAGHPSQETPWTWKLLRPLAAIEHRWRQRTAHKPDPEDDGV